MANDNLRNLWNTLKSNGYNPPEYDQFVKDMADEENLRKVHTTLRSEGYTPPAFETFKTDMAVKPVTTTTAEPQGATTPTKTEVKPPQQQGWKPSDAQWAAFEAQVEAGNRRLQQITEEGQQRLQNIQEYNKGSLGFNPGGSVKSTPQWNPQSGKFEDTYLTPFGARMNNKAVADIATRQYNEAMDMTVSGQLRRANRELADLRRQLDESATRVYEDWAEDYEKNDAPLAAVLAANTYQPRQDSDPENSALRVAIRQKEEQIKDLQEQLDRDNGVDVGFWRGFGRTVSDWRTWDFGRGDLLDALTMLNYDHYTSENATEGEKRAGQEMMQALYDKQQVEQMYGGNASFWNRAGVMTGYMPSFMIDFAMTSGGYEAINVFGKAATKGAVKWIGKEAVEEMAKTGFRQYVKKYGAKGLGREAMNWTIKSTGTMADELFIRAPLMVNTVQAADVTADAIERKLGDVVIDENGNYDFSNDKTWGSAIWQAEADATIENFSEMFGAHLGTVPWSKVANTFGAKRLSGVLARANSSNFGQIMNTTRRQFERMGMSGYFEEVAEEYYGQVWRTMLNLDDAYQMNPDGTRTNLLATGQFHGDIWGGMALSMGVMGAGKYTLSSAGYGYMKHQVNVADRKAGEIFGSEEWEALRNIIDNTPNETIGDIAEQVMFGDEYTDEQRGAIMDYMERSLNMRGYNLATLAQGRGSEVNPDEQQLNESYIDGQNARSPQEMNDAKNAYEYQRQRLGESWTDEDREDMFNWIESDPIGALRHARMNWDDEGADMLLDYLNAKMVYDGMMQGVRDGIDEQVAASDAMIDGRVNSVSGLIHPATMKMNDRKVYVVGGNLALNDDGTVDKDGTDESLIVRDAETGKLEYTDPSAILTGEQAIEPTEQKQMAAEQIRQEYAQRAANHIDGVLPFNPGDTYTINDGSGQLVDVTLVGPAVDEQGAQLPGQYIVQWPNGQTTMFDASTLQAMADAANLERLNQFEQQRQAERQQRRAAEAEASRPQYNVNDELSLEVDGQIVRGSVTAPENEDGLIEVFTEDPIKGNKVNMFTREELDAMLHEQRQSQPTVDMSLNTNEGAEPEGVHSDEPYNGVGAEVAAEWLIGSGANAINSSDYLLKALSGVFRRAGSDIEAIRQRYTGQLPAEIDDFVGTQQFYEVMAEIKAVLKNAYGENSDANAILGKILENPRGLPQRDGQEVSARVEALENVVSGQAEQPIEPVAPQAPQRTALEQIPTNEQGKPNFAAAESAELGWDALVEKTQGDEDMAQTFADNMVKSRETALSKAEKAKPKAIDDIDAFMESENQRKAAIEQAKAELEAWKRIAAVRQNRQREIERQREEEIRRRAEESRIKAEQERAEREEAERIKREALEGVPDWAQDTPANARKRGYRRFNGEKIDRQEPTAQDDKGLGKDVEPMFRAGDHPVTAKGRVFVGNVEDFQPSHLDGKQNPAHFGDEWQPKKRHEDGGVSGHNADANARNLRPELVTRFEDAFGGAPIVNARREGIQGNNRLQMLRYLYERYPEHAKNYKQYLIDHAEDFGVDPEYIRSLERPIVTMMVDATDDEANILGNIDDKEMTSGGKEELRPKNIVQKMGEKIRTFANILLRSNDDEASFNTLVGKNGIETLQWMSQLGFITDTQYASAFDTKGNLTEQAANGLKGVLYQSIFTGASTQIEEMFNKMPAKAQRAILATAFRDFDSATKDRMIHEIQQSIIAFDALNADETFREAKNIKDAKLAVQAWKQQYAFDDVSGEPYLPAERFSNFALELAAMYKGQTQSYVQGIFNRMYDIIQGAEEDTLFETADKTPKSLAEAIERVLGMEYQPINTNKENGHDGSNALDNDSGESEAERPGSAGAVTSGERNEDGEQSADSGRGTESDSGQGSEVAPSTQATAQAQQTLADPIQDEVEEMMRERFPNLVEDAIKGDEEAYKWLRSKIQRGFKIGYNRAGKIIDGIIAKNNSNGLGQTTVQVEPTSVQAVVEAASAEVDQNPTEAQKEAGNYKKGHVTIGDFDITIENPAGSVRSGVDGNGQKWETKMANAYGYIKGTESVDGDHIDVFLAENIDDWDGRRVYVVDQTKEDGTFDEHKVMLGFNDGYDAWQAYLANYDGTWQEKHPGLRISEVNIEDFKAWIDSSHRKTKPFADYSTVDKDTNSGENLSQKSSENLLEANPQIEEKAYRELYDSFQERMSQPGAIPNVKLIQKQVRDLKKRIKTLENGMATAVNSDEERVKAENALYKLRGQLRAGEQILKEIKAKMAETEKERPLSLADIQDAPKTETETETAEQAPAKETAKESEKPKVNPSGNKLVTDERYAELKARLRRKLGGQLNMGVDPEILAIGAEMAVYHIEKGARKFADFVKAIVADLEDMADQLPHQYLKGFYKSAHSMLEYEDPTIAAEMDDDAEVNKADVATIISGHVDAMATAEMVDKEQQAEKERAEAERKLIAYRNLIASIAEEISEDTFFRKAVADNDENEQETRAMELIDKIVDLTEIAKDENNSVFISNYAANNQQLRDAISVEAFRRAYEKNKRVNADGTKTSTIVENGTELEITEGDFIPGVRPTAEQKPEKKPKPKPQPATQSLFGDELEEETEEKPQQKKDSKKDEVADLKERIWEFVDPLTDAKTHEMFVRNLMDALAKASDKTISDTLKDEFVQKWPEAMELLQAELDKRAIVKTDAPSITLPEEKPAEELAGDSAQHQEREKQTAALVKEIGNTIMDRAIEMQTDPSKKGLTMSDVKKMAAKYEQLKDIRDTDLQELVELAMTNITRSVAQKCVNGSSMAQENGYNLIVSYYRAQPSLNARDSERQMKQQYSTPTPFGYVMGQFVQSHGKQVESMLEPSAGNGALTITMNPETVHVNDIDDARLANLRKLGFGSVTAQDALLPFKGEEVDAVMTNPPFGTVAEKVYDGIFKITSLEGQMAINALDSMKSDGRAAIVIGGNTSYRTNGSMNPKDAAFFGYLYSHYNVVDVINISGKALYSRNGTGYDVRMILIDGRKEGEFKRVIPPVKAKARAEQVKTFEELYNRVQDDIHRISTMGHQSADVQSEAEPTTNGGTSSPVREGSHKSHTEGGERPVRTSENGGGTSESDKPQSTETKPRPAQRPGGESRPSELDNGNGGDAGSTDNVSRPNGGRTAPGDRSKANERGGSGADGRGDTSAKPQRSGERLAVKPDLTTEKVAYPNQSENGFTLMSVVPAAQAQVLQKSLGEIGDVDAYLVDKLGYSSKEELYGYLASEQIDSVALAIRQMEGGHAFIIGDMTGVGKGRQGAALIRYAVKNGQIPIYFTQKAALFTDNYRDLSDIGSGNLRPFIIASNAKDASIVDAEGNVVYKLPSKSEQERVFRYIQENGKLPEEYDYVLTTYDQVKNGTQEYEKSGATWGSRLRTTKKGFGAVDRNGQARRDALARLADGNIAILDESHTVGGDSGVGHYMQMLTDHAKGVTFLSATFAKRADNMPIYAQRTAISETDIQQNELIDAIAKGGVTLQEIMSKQLVESGQMIRRERSFEGVNIDWMSVPEETDRKQRAQFDEVAAIFNAIRDFQDTFIKPIIEDMNGDAAEGGGTVGITRGTEAMGVRNVPFASKMYNLVNQLLFALKVDAVADRVIWNLQNGFKPVISFTNTMEGFLNEAPKGEKMDEVPNFSLTLMRALEGVMRFTEVDADENSEGGRISLSELPKEGQEAYNAVKGRIEKLSADLPISPMDAIRHKIEDAGYSVGEITGRTVQLNKTEDGKYIVESRKDRDKKAAMRDFNSGKLDVLMINKSGSTGISLHASSKFADQRQRVMVFAQFQSDINDEVQMRGRIDRTGQVCRGRYEYIMSTIPAEQRIQMMFKAKLKSLDANTTSSQKSKFNEMEIVDYLNKYGDEVVWAYMQEHPELEERLGDPLKMFNDGNREESRREQDSTKEKEGCAGKISRYLAFLSVAEQDAIFADITEAYRVKMQLLNDAGENDLEITTMPLRADTKSRKIWHQGSNPGSGNAFADHTYVEEVEVDVLKKPMKRAEIDAQIRQLAGAHYAEKNGQIDREHYTTSVNAEITDYYQKKLDDTMAKLRESSEKKIEKEREKAVKAMLKAREKGENAFTDADIQRMATEVAEEVREQEKERLQNREITIMAPKHRIQRLMNILPIGSVFVVPQDLKSGQTDMFTQSFGTFLGFKFNKGFTLGSSTAIFATLDGRRKVELPLNDEAIDRILMATSTAHRFSPTEVEKHKLENWDNNVPNLTRQTRYIITGNLLQALVDTARGERTSGNLISYSTIDGETRQGILMSESFKLSFLQNSAPISSRLAQIQAGETVTSEDGDVTVEKVSVGWNHRGDYRLSVPKSKQRGGKYTMNTKLLQLVYGQNFESRGGTMTAYIAPDNLARVLDMLSRAPFNVTVLEQSKLKDTEENANFAEESTVEYETVEGKKINYVSEAGAEAYQPSLFDFDDEAERGNRQAESVHPRPKRVQRKGRANRLLERHSDRLNKADGEFCEVERVFRESSSFNFTTGEKISGPEDVAFIFSQLEDAACEHSFAVFVKRGKPTILELGMGQYNQTMVNTPALVEAYGRLKPDKVYFVHNHPSGNLQYSQPDVNVLKAIKAALGREVVGVIVNLRTGKFGTFTAEGNYETKEKRTPTEEYPLTLYSFDRQVFADDFDPANLTPVRGSNEVAAFIQSHRLGGRDKVSILVASQSLKVTANVHTDFTTLRDEGLADAIVHAINTFGGQVAFVYGNMHSAGFHELQEQVKQKSGKSFMLHDAIRIEGEHRGEYSSANDGSVFEPGEEYGAENDDLYRIREEEPPRKTGTGYKVFVLKDGKLYPPMVANPNGEATPTGVWLDADAAPVAGTSKTGRQQVKAGGKGTQGGSGKLAYRPGWHLGVIPYALQFNRKDEVSGEKELFPANFVWAEVEYADDVDYQEEAMSYGYNKNGKFQHSYAGLPRLPKDGSYTYRTNPNPETDPWIITGAMKVNRILTPTEVDEMVKAAGREPQKRQEGAVTDEQIKALNEQIEREQRPLTETERKRAYVEEMCEKLHLDNVDIVEDATGLKGRRAKAKGWYSRSNGRITIVLSNNTTAEDVERTLLHEAVAHYGLRKMFGDAFNTFLDNVYAAASKGIRSKIAKMAAQNGWDFRTATGEYLASLAEDTNFEEAKSEPGWWTKVKSLFKEMLASIGLEGFSERGVKLSDNELRYVLWSSYENLRREGGSNDFGGMADVAMRERLAIDADRRSDVERGDLFRDGDFSPRDKAYARHAYNRMCESGSFQFREAMQDSMAGLKALYQAVLGKKTKMEDVAGFENAYLYENRMSSANAGEQYEYFLRYMKPLIEAIGNITGKSKRERERLTDYIMAKHGLERNEKMRAEAAANGENTDRDFAGLCGLTGEIDWQMAEAYAQQMVDDYESAHDTTELWEKINAATKASLEKIYISGILSQETYEKVRDMYEYYIPLRGWDETTSDEVYGYLTSHDGPLMGNIMKSAHGRRSKADDPIATIGMMADAAIQQGNRNVMKQRFLNFVLNHQSDAVSVKDLWFAYDDATDMWVPQFADLTPDMTAEEVETEIEKFEAKIEALAQADPDKYKRGREAAHIPYKVVKSNLREHQVLVKRNGRTYVITINGNPRAAQALNGLTNPDVEQGGVIGNMLKLGEYVNRQLSAFYTTRNPDFVVSNFFRDMLYSNCMSWVKENPRYALRFHKNFARVNPVTMRVLLGKWTNGKLNRSNPVEDMFYQFMKNGGETGYTSVKDIEGHKKTVSDELKKQGSAGRRAWSALGMQLELLNRSAENCARFAAFITSREFGRSIDRSIYDAKEVSVNFNKKGSGGKMVNAVGQTWQGKLGSYLGGAGRVGYVFWNAGIQGLTNFGRAGKRHPAKAIAGASALFALGYVIPILAQMLGGGDGDDDDKNAYYNLPEYVRRSNICFKAGDQWITIPLPIEYRSIYGLGELTYGVMSGNERYSNSELAYHTASQVSQILPLDMLEGGGGINAFIPSAAKPFTEAYIMNKGWTGLPVYKDTPFNKDDPEWTKAYASADQHLVAFTRWLNEVSGGDDFKKGAIDINPAKIEYLLNGTFGGLFTFPNKMKKAGETAFSDREFEWRNMPIANRVVKSGDERTANRKLQNEYFKYKEEYERTGKLLRKYEDAADEGIMGYAEKADLMYNSAEYLRYEIFDEFKGEIDALREEMADETDPTARRDIEADYYAAMRALVDALHDPDKYYK